MNRGVAENQIKQKWGTLESWKLGNTKNSTSTIK